MTHHHAATTSIPAIQVEGVSKRYGRTQALTDITFDVRPRELFALLGPNGAGKTTLLHILCTILRPDSGTVRVGGLDVIAHPAQGRRDVGVIFQEPSLDDRLTVYENLNFHGLVYGVPAKLRRQTDRGTARAGGTDRLAGQAGAHIVLRHEAPGGDRPRPDPRFPHPVPR